MGKVFDALTKARGNETIEAGSDQPLPAPKLEGGAVGSSKAAAEYDPIDEAEKLELQLKGWDERLIAVNDSFSEVAENFRRIRTHILHPATGKPPKSILITSASPQEGKSFVCANLGIILAQGVENHALLVDCDLRRPSLASIFGLPNDRGVSDHLLEGTELEHLIVRTSLQKLSLIPSGKPPVNPAEILGSQKMVDMIQEVVNRYQDRFVVFDSAPMLAASETVVIAKQVDAVVLVVRWGGAARQQVLQLVEAIDRQKIIGVVFNAFQMSELESKVSGHYYSKYGYYTAKYGYGQKK